MSELGDDESRDLASRASRGDPVSIERMLTLYVPRLHAFLRAQIAAEQRLNESVADLVQSTCRELLQAGPDFTWQGEARFRSWLFTAALNKVRMRLRSQKAQKRHHQREDGVDPSELVDGRAQLNSPSREAIGHEANASLQVALERLKPDQREVIALARLAGLPIPEVARVMGRTENAVRTLLSRSLVALSAELDRGAS
ncbi:MAG: RNA polymerase sigma factor [Planctomycetes bacterium]|jgi:RNA polymerase sigma-70 factor (ECF subfamily)|nr:RNA polymerase sigma factor [Planctomycetota bacterium]